MFNITMLKKVTVLCLNYDLMYLNLVQEFQVSLQLVNVTFTP